MLARVALAAVLAGCVAPRTAPVAAAPVVAAPAPAMVVAAPVPLAALAAPVPLDPRLAAVAATAARTAAEGYVVSAAAVRDAMIASLATDLSPYVLTARGDDAEVAAQLGPALAELRAAAALDAAGIAVATGATGRVVALVATPAPSLPVTVARADEVARIDVAWTEATRLSVYAVLPGRSHRLEPSAAAGRVEVVLDCAGDAGATVEFDAGARVVASVTAACGPPPSLAATSIEVGPPARTETEIEQRVFELILRERVALGRSPLAWDPTAQRMARTHAADMARGGYVGHVESSGATLADRVAGARLPAGETFENVGHASGPGEAHYAFMASPAHRANLLASAARRGAVGVVRDPLAPDAFYITEVLFAPAGATR